MNVSTHRLIRRAGGVVAVLLIAAAVLLSVLRIALPFASDYRAALEQRVASHLGTPVSIEEMQVEWHRLGPRLRLLGVEISGPPPAREPVRFEEAVVDLGLSLDGDRPYPVRVSSVALIGCRLEVRLDREGRLSLLGAQIPAERLVPRGEEPPPVVQRIAAWLLGTDGLRLLDTEITVRGPGEERWTLGDIRVSVLNEGADHELAVSARLPQEWGDRVRFVLDASGQRIDEPGTWNGRFYARGEGLALARLSALYSLPVNATRGRADVEAWFDFGDGRLNEVQADLLASDLELEGRAGQGVAGFERLGGELRWHRGGGDWSLDVGQLEVRRAGRDWPEAGFSVARQVRDGRTRWRAGADFIRLEDALALAGLAEWPEELAREVWPRQPRGDVHAMRLDIDHDGEFRLRAGLRDAGWRPVNGVPGASGIDGGLRLAPDRAALHLETRDGAVAAPGILAEPVPLATADGTVRASRMDGGGIRIRSTGLALENRDARGSVRFDIAGGADALDLDVEADFQDAAVAAATRYLPVGPIPSRVLDYLERMLVGGTVTEGRLRLEGPLAGFPYRDGGGTFTVELAARDATIAYAPGWPRLEGLDGRVRFDGPGLEMQADGGHVYGIELESLEARIPDLAVGELEVATRADAPVDDLVRLVNESPLAKALGRGFAGARGEGSAPVALDLSIPLREPRRVRVDGEMAMDGIALLQPRFGLDIRDIDGALRFSRDGVEMDGVRARIRGRPVELSARVGHGDDHANLVRATGSLGLQDMPAAADSPLAQRIEGRSPWNVQLRVPLRGGGEPVLSGVSDLAGTRIDLPAPFAKAAGTERRLAFSLPLPAAGPLDMRVDYGELARARLELRMRGGGLEWERALLRLGDGSLAMPAEPGLHVRGELERLALAGWLDVAAARGGAGGPGLGSIVLDVGEATHSGRSLSNLALRVRRDSGRWSVRMRSNELTGTARIPLHAAAGAPIRLRFEWIDLGLLGVSGGADVRPGDLGPGAIPPLDVRVDRLKTRNATLRDFALATSPDDGAMVIHRLEFSNEGLGLSGQGRWRAEPHMRTSLRLAFEGDDFGTGLADLGHGGALVDGSGRVTGDLAWPDVPWSPSLEGLEGHARIQLEDGLIPEVDPGAARLLALLSLRALPQILTLDFRGLVQKGYAFDRIDGRIDFADGNAYSRGLEIDGPIGRMWISGRTGLVARDYDQTLRFQPELSSSLPLLGGLAGGPVTGIAVALVQAVLRNVGADVEEATELRYSLTGPWSDPVLEQLNTGGEDRERRGRTETPLGDRP